MEPQIVPVHMPRFAVRAFFPEGGKLFREWHAYTEDAALQRYGQIVSEYPDMFVALQDDLEQRNLYQSETASLN